MPTRTFAIFVQSTPFAEFTGAARLLEMPRENRHGNWRLAHACVAAIQGMAQSDSTNSE